MVKAEILEENRRKWMQKARKDRMHLSLHVDVGKGPFTSHSRHSSSVRRLAAEMRTTDGQTVDRGLFGIGFRSDNVVGAFFFFIRVVISPLFWNGWGRSRLCLRIASITAKSTRSPCRAIHSPCFHLCPGRFPGEKDLSEAL